MSDQLTESQALLRSEQKRCTEQSWVNIPLPCDVGSADRVASFASKWAKEVHRTMMRNIPLPCDVGSGDRVASFASKWAKEVHRRIMRNIPLPCDVGSADRVASFASKWAKEVHRTMVRNIPLPCDVGAADRVASFASKWAKEVSCVLFVSVPTMGLVYEDTEWFVFLRAVWIKNWIFIMVRVCENISILFVKNTRAHVVYEYRIQIGEQRR